MSVLVDAEYTDADDSMRAGGRGLKTGVRGRAAGNARLVMDVVPDDAVVMSGGHRFADCKDETRVERSLQETQNLLALRIVWQIAHSFCAVIGAARVRVLRLHTQHLISERTRITCNKLPIRKYGINP